MILIHIKQQAILLIKAQSRSTDRDLVHPLVSYQFAELVLAQTGLT